MDEAGDQGPLATEQPPPQAQSGHVTAPQTPQTLFSGLQGPHAYTGSWEVSSCEPT